MSQRAIWGAILLREEKNVLKTEGLKYVLQLQKLKEKKNHEVAESTAREEQIIFPLSF